MRSERFEYKPSFDSTVDRAERKGSMFDNMFKEVKLFKAKVGVNLIRILLPGWEKANHYGLRIMVHWNVGPMNRKYLCLRENEYSPHKKCPVCAALYELGLRATQDDKKELRPRESILYYIIDRDAEKEGVQVWMTSPSRDSEIAAQSVNRRNGTVLNISHPDKGYDIEFTRTGTDMTTTKYRGLQVMRESSPLADSDKRFDEWLDVAFEKPLPEILNFYSPEHIEEVFLGQSKEEEEKPRSRARDGAEDNEEPAPKLERRRSFEPEEDSHPEVEQPRRQRRTQPEPEEKESPRRRTRLQEDLDDEVPFDTKSNGKDTEEDPAPRRRSRAPVDDDAEEREERPARRSRSNEDNEPSSRRRSSSEDDEKDVNDSARSRMRERLNRE